MAGQKIGGGVGRQEDPSIHDVQFIISRQISVSTGILSQIRTKLRDWAVWQARAGCYSQAALSSNDSKTL